MNADIVSGALSAPLDVLLPHAQDRTFHGGEILVRHGDAAQHVWIVRRGWVKLIRQTPDGKETVVGLCTAGEMFGEAALFPGGIYPYHAEVLGEESSLAMIPAHEVQMAIRNNTQLSKAIMMLLNERITQAELRLEHTNTMSAAQRLGCFLLRLSKGGGGKTSLDIPVEKHVLASYLGIKPETLSRAQQQLKSEGVDISRFHAHLADIHALREFVCSSCSKPPGNCNQID